MEPILQIEKVSKKFRIAHKQNPYLSLRDSFKNPFSNRGSSSEEFWALKEVSFDVMPGEAIGVIGKNGAGKSTLLKILSKITPPTEGRIISRGRIASLLEVGTGFHAELSGRENIFFNGSILGMKRKEIQRKFDEIVDFSGVEKFLDTPLKHYSSGMQLRLAFAVAAFLEPEILLIDEILAVGDADFQKKCMGKMNEVSKSGRTVLFVSHNMTAMEALCPKSILLIDGKVNLFAETSNVCAHYLKTDLIRDSFDRMAKASGITITKGKLLQTNQDQNNFLEAELEVTSDRNTKSSIDFRIFGQNGTPVGFGSLGALNEGKCVNLRKGKNMFNIKVDVKNLANGSYYMGIDLTVPNIEYFDRVENVLHFDVRNVSEDGFSRVFSLDWNYGPHTFPITLIQG